MENFFSNSSKGFNWWLGVVEDRDDPLRIGRCRVRIYGYHTSSTEILPTRDLPWAWPIMPVTSAGISGIGWSPTGPVEGSTVFGFFLDGEECQQPAMLGVMVGKHARTNFDETPTNTPVLGPGDGSGQTNGADRANPEINPLATPLESASMSPEMSSTTPMPNTSSPSSTGAPPASSGPAPAAVASPEQEFWTIVAVCSREENYAQGWADVAQVIYNRMKCGQYHGQGAVENITANSQFEPTWRFPKSGENGKANPEWKQITDVRSAALATGQSVEHLNRVAEALKNKEYQKNAAAFVEGRTDFKGVGQPANNMIGRVQRNQNTNQFGWQYNYKQNVVAGIPKLTTETELA